MPRCDIATNRAFLTRHKALLTAEGARRVWCATAGSGSDQAKLAGLISSGK